MQNVLQHSEAKGEAIEEDLAIDRLVKHGEADHDYVKVYEATRDHMELKNLPKNHPNPQTYGANSYGHVEMKYHHKYNIYNADTSHPVAARTFIFFIL